MVLIAGGLIIGIALLGGLLGAGHAGSGSSDGSGTGTSNDSSVHVCTLAHYDKSNVVCTQDDATIPDLGNAKLQVQAADGANFAKDTLIIDFDQVNQDGSQTPVGSTTDSGNLGEWTSSWALDGILSNAGVEPEAGSTYEVRIGYSDQANGMAQLLNLSQGETRRTGLRVHVDSTVALL